jgi:tRNA A-37 threonylcarbamoyl transferase component Bud32
MGDLTGTALGNYDLVRLLGQGGFARVYLGRHRYLHTLAAIKVLEAYLDDEQREPFEREARTIAQLVHPHIVRVLEFGAEAGTPFLVMDYAAAGSLRTRHPRGAQLPLGRILPYVQQIASALEYAHQHQVIHRDVKPANVLLGRDDALWLSDFGLAMMAHRTGSLPTEQAIGTASYMAPEQIEGKPRPASDQYALAVMVYEWLVGAPPFGGTALEVAMQHLASAPPPLAGVEPPVQEVLLRALAKDHRARFASVQAFADALQQASVPHAPGVTRPLHAVPDDEAPTEPDPALPAAPLTPVMTAPLTQAVAEAELPAMAEPELPAVAAAAVPISQAQTQPIQPANAPPATAPRRRRRLPARRWLLAVAAVLALLLVGSLFLLPGVGLRGVAGTLLDVSSLPTAGAASGATATQPGQTRTPGATGTAGTRATPGPGATTAPTAGVPTATTPGVPTATLPAGVPTPTGTSPPGASATPTLVPGALVAAPLTLSFSLTLLGCLVQARTQLVTLQNTGGAALTWQASIENPAYLTTAPASGSLAGGQSTQLGVSVICPSISLNTIDHITLLWGGVPITITVTISIL